MKPELRTIIPITLEDLLHSDPICQVSGTIPPTIKSPFYRLDEVKHPFNYTECVTLRKNHYLVKLSHVFGSNPKKLIPALGAITTTLEVRTKVIDGRETVVNYGGCKTENTLPPRHERTYAPAPASVTPSTNMAIVIDLETVSLSVDSKIIEVGAVFGDLTTGEIYGTFYAMVAPDNGLNVNRTTSISTLQWHLDTRKTQLGHLPLPELEEYEHGKVLDDVLIEFSKWIDACHKSYDNPQLTKDAVREIRYYSKGPEFDIAKLVHAYEQLSNKEPFNYRAVASIRNFEHLYASVICSKYDKPKETYKNSIADFHSTESVCPHDAFYDAVSEFHFAHLVINQLFT